MPFMGHFVTRENSKLLEAKREEFLKVLNMHEMIRFCHIILVCLTFPPTISISVTFSLLFIFQNCHPNFQLLLQHVKPRQPGGSSNCLPFLLLLLPK